MRYKEFGYLIEGYPQAQAEFSKEADPAVVQKAILDFRSLVNRSQIKVITQKNIDYWIKQGWEKFETLLIKLHLYLAKLRLPERNCQVKVLR